MQTLTFLALSSIAFPIQPAGGANEPERLPEVIRVTGYSPYAWDPATRARRAALEHFLTEMRNPASGRPWGESIRIEPDNPLSFPGFSLKVVTFAAGTGEEVIATTDGMAQFFRYRDQKFLLPLNPYIWEVRRNAEGEPLRTADGSWDYLEGPDEGRRLLWEGWRRIPQVYREMMEWQGEVHGLPVNRHAHGLLFRKDLFRAAGLNPDQPPSDWDALFEHSLALSAAGGKRVHGIRVDTDLVHAFLLGAGGAPAQPITRPDGTVRWISLADSAEMHSTVAFIRRLALTKWVVTPDHGPQVVWWPDNRELVPHPALGMPVWNGYPGNRKSGLTLGGQPYGPEKIRSGVALNAMGSEGEMSLSHRGDPFTRIPGGVAMRLDTPGGLVALSGEIDPGLLGFGPVPEGASGRRLTAHGEAVGLNFILAHHPEKARLAWEVVSFLAGEEHETMVARSFAREGEGIAETLPPALLAEAGLETIVDRIPPPLSAYWESLEQSLSPVVPARNFRLITDSYLAPVLDLALTDPFFDYPAALTAAREQIQARLDFAAGDYSSVPHRRAILAAMLGVLLVVLVGTSWAVGSMIRRARTEPAETGIAPLRGATATGWLLLAPAMLLVSIFSYYPIFRALPIAFQEFTVAGPVQWTGAANFVEVFGNPVMWISLARTGYFLLVSVGIGFIVPVVLAVLLNEIRVFRRLLQTIYYLPAVVAGIVLLLMWQRFFDAAETGLINTIYLRGADLWNALAPDTLHLAREPVDWLRDRFWGIPAVAFVGIWGGAGPGMLIYLAALKSIPGELYEVAEMDGAGWLQRFWHISISYLRPLLVINLIGAVIGAFQASSRILALAGNSDATRTFAVHIWVETFGLGNFGVGTALSWLMAAILVAFTVQQLRTLKRVDSRRPNRD